MSDKKEGIELILDRAEALRVRLSHAQTTTLLPPADAGDHRLADLLGHWEQLVKEILVETISLRAQGSYRPAIEIGAALDRVGALMAMPRDAKASEIAKAVEIALRRLQDLELKQTEFREAHTPSRGMRFTTDNGPPPRGLAKGIQIHGDFDAAKKYWLDKLAETLSDDEPRPSYVIERLEGLVLGGWLGDAVKNLERVAEYMVANESRMSEDVFDELRRVASKLSAWADEISRGNMFPTQGL